MALVRTFAIGAAITFALTASIDARADSWKFPPKVETETFDHGAVRVVQTRDARRDQQMPDFLMEVFHQGERVASFPGVWVDQVFASDDQQVFVGLSNVGIPGTAVIAFNARGRLTLHAQHGLAEFDYCEKSVTLQRVWYDEDRPNVRFRLEGWHPGTPRNSKPGIFLRSCGGREIELIATVQEAFARAAAREKLRPAK